MSPTNAELRQFIMGAFNDEELVTLCHDYFPEVYQNFGDGLTKNRKALALIGYCDSRGLLENLRVTLAKERPAAWQAQFAAPVETGRRPVSTTPARPARRDPRQIFLSHATADADFAQQLAADLREEGWTVWIAPDSIRPGEKWVEAINRGLEESGVFVVALSPDAVGSRWVQTETNAAIDLHHADEMRLITLDVVQCKLPILWRQYQYIPFRASYETGLDALLGWLDGEAAASPRPGETGRRPVSTTTTPPQPVETGRRPVSTTPAVPNRRIHQKTGIELIRIPAGPFLYGSADSDKLAFDDEKPQQRIDLPEYWIGRAPVTNAQYKTFVDATGHRSPGHWRGKSPPPDKLDHPVVNVDWNDAQAFCDWAGLQLPSEQAWEKAARGTDGRIWPWGNDRPTAEHSNFNRNVGDTTPAGRYSPRGDSPYGCVDMAGNVREWTASWYTQGRTRAVRGGSWLDYLQYTRAACRLNYLPYYRDDFIGFRVAEHLSDPDP